MSLEYIAVSKSELSGVSLDFGIPGEFVAIPTFLPMNMIEEKPVLLQDLAFLATQCKLLLFGVNSDTMTVIPDDGSIYSNNGSNFKVLRKGLVAGSTTMYNILLHRISGTNDIETSGVLTKISGGGDNTIDFINGDRLENLDITVVIDTFTVLPASGVFYINNSVKLVVIMCTKISIDPLDTSYLIKFKKISGENLIEISGILTKDGEGDGDATYNYTDGQPLEKNNYTFITGCGLIKATAINNYLDNRKPLRENDSSTCAGCFLVKGLTVLCNCNVKIENANQTTITWE